MWKWMAAGILGLSLLAAPIAQANEGHATHARTPASAKKKNKGKKAKARAKGKMKKAKAHHRAKKAKAAAKTHYPTQGSGMMDTPHEQKDDLPPPSVDPENE